MSDNIAIKVEKLYKSFKIPHEKHSSLKGAVLNLFSNKGFTKYDAAKGISFEVKKGEFLGIIGRNGCGKSTMLKMLAGIYQPDSGSIKINGTLSPFLELGVGFNPELSARDNIYLNGSILGMSRKQIDQIFDKIVSFAELEEFIDMKLKNFSSGMQVRLAFSVAINAHADILLIDEVLAVGDVNFQKKCFEVFKEFKNQGKTIVFVSHSMGSIRDFCDRVLVFNKGEKVFDGEIEGAVDLYNEININKKLPANQEASSLSPFGKTYGSHRARFLAYEIFDKDGNLTTILETGERFSIICELEFLDDIINPTFGAMFRLEPNENLFGMHNYHRNNKILLKSAKKGDKYKITFKSEMPLNSGSYYLSLSVAEQQSVEIYEDLELLNNFTKIEVVNSQEIWGLVNVCSDIEITKLGK